MVRVSGLCRLVDPCRRGSKDLVVSGALNLVLGLGVRTWTLKSKAVPCALTHVP